RLAAHPGIMAGRDLEDVTRTELEFRAVGHLGAQSPGKRDPQMVVLARLRAGNRLDVHRPAPSRLIGHPADDRIVEIDDVDPTMRNRPHVAWFTESPSLETHSALPAAIGPSGDVSKEFWTRSRVPARGLMPRE